jgi:hypothetical protein
MFIFILTTLLKWSFKMITLFCLTVLLLNEKLTGRGDLDCGLAFLSGVEFVIEFGLIFCYLVSL